MTNVEGYRREVTQRAQRRCEYCFYPQSASSTLLEIDHVIPESKGGLTKLDNLALNFREPSLAAIVIPINGLKQKVLTQ